MLGTLSRLDRLGLDRLAALRQRGKWGASWLGGKRHGENSRKMLSVAKAWPEWDLSECGVGAALGCWMGRVGPRPGLGVGCPWWQLVARSEAQGRFLFR